MPIIEVNQVVKRYRLGQSHGIRQTFKRLLGKEEKPVDQFRALDGVSFSVESGEVLGIIGTNGAGKSTLLKVLAGISTPTSGSMVSRGRVAPLIEVGAGLIAELTGRENIYLNGVILGMTVREIKQKFDDIVAFAELEKFIDTPIKRYSSGMAVRLGFAIATSVDCEILIVDEVLAVGDVAFQRKCFDRIEDIIKKQGKTILLVSHNIRQVERLCTRTLLLDKGKVIVDGETREVCRQFYERTNAKMKSDAIAMQATRDRDLTRSKSLAIELIDIHPIDSAGRALDAVPFREDMTVRIRFRALRRVNELIFGLGVHTSDMLYLATHDSDIQLRVDSLEAGDYSINCKFCGSPLVPGVYSLRLGIFEDQGATHSFYGENLVHFQVTTFGTNNVPPISPDGFFALDGQWGRPCALKSASTQDAVNAA